MKKTSITTYSLHVIIICTLFSWIQLTIVYFFHGACCTLIDRPWTEFYSQHQFTDNYSQLLITGASHKLSVNSAWYNTNLYVKQFKHRKLCVNAKTSLHSSASTWKSILYLFCCKLTNRIVRIITSILSNDPYSGKSSPHLVIFLKMLGKFVFYFGVIPFRHTEIFDTSERSLEK